MTTQTNIKAPVPVATVENSNLLTIVVVDAKSQPIEGAHVSIAPSNETGVTNKAGEIQFKLGNVLKYDITATADSSTVTVPYYVTKNGATRLVINPVYVKSVEQKLHPSSFGTTLFSTVSIILCLAIVGFVVWKFYKRGK
jgi:hypothetical protein